MKEISNAIGMKEKNKSFPDIPIRINKLRLPFTFKTIILFKEDGYYELKEENS